MPEDPRERVNRELIELLNELRVALPGVQVLFAFLLAVPFQQRFAHASAFERAIYYTTLCCALVSTALLIAPSALHRLNFRRTDKLTLVLISNRLVIAGMAALALALVGVMVLVSDVLFGEEAVVIGGVLAGLVLVGAWVVLPLRERRRGRAHEAAEQR
jgi:hypothetical protein